MNALFLFPHAVKRDEAIEKWLREYPDILSTIARRWLQVVRDCGTDVRELMHDGHPTACVSDAAFAYIDAFKAHVSIGFYCGAELSDPKRLLEGAGKSMRHVKLKPEQDVDAAALKKLIKAAYADMRKRVEKESRNA